MQAKLYNYMKRAVRFLFHLLWVILQTGVFKILSCLGFKAQNVYICISGVLNQQVLHAKYGPNESVK